MKKHLNVAILMVAMILGLSAVSPVLSQEQSRGVTIGRDTKVGGKPLEKGNYTLKFVEGKEGELVFLHGKREVVKASYETTKLTTPASDNSVVYRLAGDGSVTISRIEFKGMDTALVIK
jgi:hypothetical protein